MVAADVAGCFYRWETDNAEMGASPSHREVLMPASSPQACIADFTAALIDRDIERALTLLTDDVVFFYSNGSAIVGKMPFPY